GSGQHKSRPKWIMAGEQVETSRVYARNVAKIEPAWVEKAASHLVKREHYGPHWEKKAARCAVFERISLYGLTLETRRKVPYEKIDPSGAREIFIRSGLVEQDYTTNAPFFHHNQALLEDVGYIQHKGRRVDLIEDEEWLFSFYDQRIPSSMVNGITFDQWRKQVEKDTPKLLFLTKQDLTRKAEGEVSDENFPDEILIGTIPVQLHYRFEPGHEEDGVTAIIPLHQLNHLSNTAFEWLVPGLLREKVIALLKGLPKSLRRNFVPVPDYADRCLQKMRRNEGALLQVLARTLKELTGLRIPDDAWITESLPAHLKMNFRIVDEKGKQLSSSRNLDALKRKLGDQAGEDFRKLTADEMSRSGCTAWEFEDLPRSYEITRNGGMFMAYSAVVDEGETVGVAVFDTETKAEQEHRKGLNRLFQLQLRKELKYVRKNIPAPAAIELIYRNLPPPPFLARQIEIPHDYRDDVLSLVIDTVFLEREEIRSAKVFSEKLHASRSRLAGAATEIGDTLLAVMESYREIKKRLATNKHPSYLAHDIGAQLDCLVFAGFLQKTPYHRIKEFPRYFKAILHRLEKVSLDAVRDEQKLSELMPFWSAYWGSLNDEDLARLAEPESDSFRWDLEEFRVSLFAQSLKTAYPISAKRLEKAWQARPAR
ncbi:MAG: DUF3418 domain-containing protein, partial [Pseudomonadota bacterium]